MIALLGMAHAHEPEAAWPTHVVDLATFTPVDGAFESPWLDAAGSRVALVVTVPDAGPPLALWAQGSGGDWRPVDETHRDGERRVLVADLREDGALYAFSGVRFRIAATDLTRVDVFEWDALVPRFPLAGARSRETSQGPWAFAAAALPPELITIGVVPRSAWGSRATGCSTLESDWYRMAIHHTAGDQVSGGTVEGALRTTQAYMMDSGGYCDLAYQFMLGYEGTVFEGRPYGYYSGATGGNNDGNAAACFLGCYHPEPACPTAHAATDEMIESAQLLVQTFSTIHNFATTSSDVRGHRDWPDNATACPGDFVIDRIDEIRADLAWFEATEVDRSDTELTLAPGDDAEVWITLRNDGGLPWEAGDVNLGTTGPRDGASDLSDGSWIDANRAATVPSTTLRGDEATFTFTVTAPADLGTHEVTLGLVADGVTWFADAPWGGGPADDLLTVTVEVVDEVGTEPDPTDDTDEDTGDEPPVDVPPSSFAPPARVPLDGGCGCASAPGGSVLPFVAALALLRRPRRGQPTVHAVGTNGR